MKRLIILSLVLTSLTTVSVMQVNAKETRNEEEPVSFIEVSNNIKKIHDYFYEHNYCDTWNWNEVTYHLGVMEAYKATGHTEYYQESYEYAEGYSWQVNEGVLDTYLDQVTGGLLYSVLHDLAPADYKLAHSIQEADYICSRGMLDSSWIDEIYMIGLTLSYLSKVTGNPWYSEVDFTTYKYYRERYLDPEDGLWYRDEKYISGNGFPWSTSPNGKKVYWGRGNTWVYVSLGQRLEYMDKNDPAYETYLNDFLMMSNGLRKAVRDDGVWGANLADVRHSPGKEMTGTGGFLYGLCLGIEYGLLDYDTYFPIVEKAYRTISSLCIRDDGLLKYCQPVGEGPDGYPGGEAYHENSTNSFGVGLMMMGLSRFMRLTHDYQTPVYTHTVEPFNPDNAKYTVDKNFYKGTMIATSTAPAQEKNGPENLVNGLYSRADHYGRMSLSGLSSNNIVVNINILKTISINKIAVLPFRYRAYKFTLEAYVNDEWVTMIDTRETPSRWSYLFKYNLSQTYTTNQLRLTGYGCWNETTDMFSIKELFIYEGGAL